MAKSSSIKELTSLMQNTGIHSKTKRKSEMEALLQQQYKHITHLSSLENQSKTVIVTGVVKESVITIYGEIHDDINNVFYEKLDLKGHTVFVEHSTVFCKLEPHEHAMFANAKGSEWIWFTCTRKKQQVTCVDTRLENGFLSGYEEIAIQTMKVKDLLECVSRVIKAATAIKEKYSRIQRTFDDIISAMKRQFLMMLLLDKSKESHIKVNDKLIDKNIVVDATRNFLISNTIKISSLSVDMHIIDLVSSQHNSGAPISIFVGINHALRLSEFLELYIVTENTDKDYDYNIFYEGDEKSEKEIITQLKKS